MDVEEQRMKEKVKESVVKRLEEKKHKLVALIREEKVDLERVKDKYVEEARAAMNKIEQKMENRLREI